MDETFDVVPLFSKAVYLKDLDLDLDVKKIISTNLPGVTDDNSRPTPDPDIPTTSVGGIGGLVPNLEAITGPDISQQPVQAFVVENDISNSQALQEELEIQATL